MGHLLAEELPTTMTRNAEGHRSYKHSYIVIADDKEDAETTSGIPRKGDSFHQLRRELDPFAKCLKVFAEPIDGPGSRYRVTAEYSTLPSSSNPTRS